MKKFDWQSIATVRFKPKLLDHFVSSRGSCGTYALYCLTGIPLPKIEKECPKKGWWDDASMRKFLKKQGYQTIPLTESIIQSSKPYRYRDNINHQHIILISTHSSKEEGTWAVAYGNKLYHGSEIEFFSGYEMLINPLWTAYLVWHPKWRSSEKQKKTDCEMFWIFPKGDKVFHPMTGNWFKTEETSETRPSSSKVRRLDRSYGSGTPRRAQRRNRS